MSTTTCFCGEVRKILDFSVEKEKVPNLELCILVLKVEQDNFFCLFITKTCLYNFDPLKPHLYIIKLGFTGVYIILIISAQQHRLWVLVRTASQRWF